MADLSAFSTGLTLGQQGLERLFGPLAASSLAGQSGATATAPTTRTAAGGGSTFQAPNFPSDPGFSGAFSAASPLTSALLSGGSSLMNPINFAGLTFPPAFFLTAPLAVGAGILGREMGREKRHLAVKQAEAGQTFNSRIGAFRDAASAAQGSEDDALAGLERLFVTMRDSAGGQIPGQGFGGDQTLGDFLEGRVTWPGFGGSEREAGINFEFAPLGEGLRRTLLTRFPGLRERLDRPLNPIDAGRPEARRRATAFARDFPGRVEGATARALSPTSPGVEEGGLGVPGWAADLLEDLAAGRPPRRPAPPPTARVQFEQLNPFGGNSTTESGPVTLSQDPGSMLWSPRIVGGNSADGFLVESGPGNLVTVRPGDPGYAGLLAQMQAGG